MMTKAGPCSFGYCKKTLIDWILNFPTTLESTACETLLETVKIKKQSKNRQLCFHRGAGLYFKVHPHSSEV